MSEEFSTTGDRTCGTSSTTTTTTSTPERKSLWPWKPGDKPVDERIRYKQFLRGKR